MSENAVIQFKGNEFKLVGIPDNKYNDSDICEECIFSTLYEDERLGVCVHSDQHEYYKEFMKAVGNNRHCNNEMIDGIDHEFVWKKVNTKTIKKKKLNL